MQITTFKEGQGTDTFALLTAAVFITHISDA